MVKTRQASPSGSKPEKNRVRKNNLPAGLKSTPLTARKTQSPEGFSHGTDVVPHIAGKSEAPRKNTGKAKVSHPEEDMNGNGKIRFKSLVINGTKYRTRLNQKFERRKSWQSPDPRKISSGIPGTVIKVYVEEGQEVKAGDQMLILEAMKMKNRIMFHTGGTVKAVHVKEGEKIPKDFLMLELG
jgi:biotin carboxyl carrier protein